MVDEDRGLPVSLAPRPLPAPEPRAFSRARSTAARAAAAAVGDTNSPPPPPPPPLAGGLVVTSRQRCVNSSELLVSWRLVKAGLTQQMTATLLPFPGASED